LCGPSGTAEKIRRTKRVNRVKPQQIRKDRVSKDIEDRAGPARELHNAKGLQMTHLFHTVSYRASFRTACLSAVVLCGIAGCKSSAPVADDATLTRNLQTQLSQDGAISGQPIQASVQNGVATLNGSVTNDAQKTIAGRDATGIPGVKQVMNNLTIATPPQASAASVTQPPVLVPGPPIPAPAIPVKKSAAILKPERPEPRSDRREPAPIERSRQGYNDQQRNNGQQPYNNNQQAQAPVPQAPPPPPQPVFRDVTVPSGSVLPVRMTQTLDSATTQEGAAFSGVVASDIMVDGIVAIPAGTNVSGHVDTVHEAAHFSGAALLTVSLSSVNRRGDRIPITTEPYTVEGKGRGKNTAEKAGGGAAVGAILGGIFGGGKGAAIGAATGGGLGAGANAVTRGQQVQIPSETVVRFRLSGSVPIHVRTDHQDRPDRADRPVGDPTLQPRN
jgi:hypothetical protein